MLIYKVWKVICTRCRMRTSYTCYDFDVPLNCPCGGLLREREPSDESAIALLPSIASTPSTYAPRISSSDEKVILGDLG